MGSPAWASTWIDFFCNVLYVGIVLGNRRDFALQVCRRCPQHRILTDNITLVNRRFRGGFNRWHKTVEKKKSTRPIKIAFANMTDLSLITNMTVIGIGVLFYNTFRPLYYRISYFALPVATWISFFPPIIGVPLAVDFIMPRLWQAAFKHQYGFAQGRLLKNLTSASKKGELRRDFYKRTRFYLLATAIIYVMTIVLVLLGSCR